MNLEKEEKIFLDKVLELKFNETYKPLFLDVMKDIYVHGNPFSLSRFVSLNIFSVDEIVNFALKIGFPNLICFIAKSIYSWPIEEDEMKKNIDKLATAIIETNDPFWIWQFLSAITLESPKLPNNENTLEKLIDAIVKTKDLMRMKFCLRILVQVDCNLSKKLKDKIIDICDELDESSDKVERVQRIRCDVEYVGRNLAKTKIKSLNNKKA